MHIMPSTTPRFAMTDARSSEESTVIATYSTRRDAEVAKDYLDSAGIQAFVTADDAGGMHPELQRSQGVKLSVLGSAAREAHGVLEEAGLLPSTAAESSPPRSQPADQSANVFFSTEGPIFTAVFVVVAVLIVLGLMIIASL